MKFKFYKFINIEYSDERIEKQTNKLYFKAYFITQIIAIISLGQIFSPLNKWWDFSIQFLVLIIFNIYTAIILKINELDFKSVFNPEDEYILEMRNKVFKKVYLQMFRIILLIEFIVVIFILNPHINLFIKGDSSTQIALNIIGFVINGFAIWFIPALYFTYASIKEGIFVGIKTKQGTSNNKSKFNKNKFRLRCLYMAIFFSIFQFIANPVFILSNVLKVIGAGVFFGVFFYFVMIAMIKLGEKRANKDL